jgi:hypothetical protein
MLFVIFLGIGLLVNLGEGENFLNILVISAVCVLIVVVAGYLNAWSN